MAGVVLVPTAMDMGLGPDSIDFCRFRDCNNSVLRFRFLMVSDRRRWQSPVDDPRFLLLIHVLGLSDAGDSLG